MIRKIYLFLSAICVSMFLGCASTGNTVRVKPNCPELARSAEKGDLQRVKYLTKQCNINSSYDFISALQRASFYMKGNVVEYLLDQGADANYVVRPGDKSALIFAVENAQKFSTSDYNLPIIKLLVLKGKANVNYRTSKGYTPLYVAGYHFGKESVKFLIEQGADPAEIERGIRAMNTDLGSLNNMLSFIGNVAKTVKEASSSTSTSTSTSSSTSSSLKSYKCSFCCEGQFGTCSSKKFEVPVRAANSSDAGKLIEKDYKEICIKYPFYSKSGMASVGYTDCKQNF